MCFADESSTNILVSGSDDGYVKVWDRRSLSSNTPSGILVGATEGVTYTSPKGDGRYIVVNSKDQAARLYDLRKMRDPGEFKDEPDAVTKYGQSNFDCACSSLVHILALTTSCRSRQPVSSATSHGPSERLFCHDFPRTFSVENFDSMPLQSATVDRTELYLFWKVRDTWHVGGAVLIFRQCGWYDSHLVTRWTK